MQQAILITGFQSWGKSRHIQMLFKKKRFSPQKYFPADKSINHSFLVESRSNDDVGHESFINNVTARYKRSGENELDLIAAFCPSRDPKNDALTILKSPVFERFGRVHVVLLQYRWDWHAELRLSEVCTYLQRDKRVCIVVVNSDANCTSDNDRLLARDASIREYLRQLY